MTLKNLLRTKSIEALQAETGRPGQLRRVLGLWQLSSIGLGGLIGVGIFVLTGVVAATQAGPAVSLSFVIAGVASGAAALCYAEFASMIPVAGSAYTYAYAVLGELVAWIIGWDLLLEYALVVAVVSIGWSGYLQALLRLFGVELPVWAQGAPAAGEGFRVDLFAMLGSLGVAGLLTLRVEWGARFNTAIVLIKVAAVLLVIAAAAPHIDPANFHPFMPFGFGGVVEGAAVVFFAVFGYDTLTTAAEESRDPQRDLPRAVLLSLAISLTLYIAMSLALTGIVRYDTLNNAAPVANAFAQIGMPWVTLIVSLAAVAGILSVMLAFLLACARIWFAMSRDGLLPAWFAVPHPRIRHALSPDLGRRRALRPGRGFLSDSRSRGTREHRHAVGLRGDLSRGDRPAPRAPGRRALVQDSVRALHAFDRNRIFAVAAVEIARRRLGALRGVAGPGAHRLFFIWAAA